MKKYILIAIMAAVSVLSCGQTYSTCKINGASSNIKEANGSDKSDMYDGDWGSYWRSYSWEDVYINDYMQLNIQNPQLVDYVAIKRDHQANRTGTERYPGLQFWYIETGGTNKIDIQGGTFANGEQTTKSFNIGKNIKNIGFRVVSGNYSASATNYNHMSLHEIELRRYHRLALTLTQDAGLVATQNSTAAPITILSTQNIVHYDTKITGVNRKFEGWYWNGTRVNQGNYFDYNHTVNTINGTGTMHAKAVDCIPTFERANLSLPIGLGHYTNPLTTDENDKAAKTFTSSNTAVATVDNAGELTLKAVGTTTITMTQPNWGVYGPMEASYTLVVDYIGVHVTSGAHAGYHAMSALPASIQGATKITTIGEGWTDANMAKLKTAMVGSKTTLLEMDMETLTFSGNILNGMQSMFNSGYTALKKVTLPNSAQTSAISLQSAFSSCAALTDIINFPNLHNINNFTETFSGCTSLTNVSLLLSSNATNNNIVMLYSTFDDCKALTNIDLTSYTNIYALHSLFNNCLALKTVTFSTVANNNSVTMCQAFANCSALEYVNNFNSFKKVSDFSRTFKNCSSLKEIRLGVEPNTINFAKLSETFTSANNTYLKYLPTCSSVVPSAWHAYKNFVIAITVADIPAYYNAQKDAIMPLPTAPAVNAAYAARKNARWEIFDGTAWIEWQNNMLVSLADENREVRYAAQSYCDEWAYSNVSHINLLGKYFVVTGGANAGKHFIDVIANTPIAGATKVQVLGEGWTDAEFAKIKNIISGSKTTITEFDLSTCAVSGDMTTSFTNICQNFTALRTMKFFGAYTSAQFNLEGAFEGCANLTTVSNINNIHQITCLRSTFANCAKLLRIDFRDQDSGHELYMYRAFYGCSSLTEVVNIDNFSWIKNLEMAFEGCSSLTKLVFRDEKEETQITMRRAFFGCTKLHTIANFGRFREINNMQQTFEGCKALKSIDLRIKDGWLDGSLAFDNDNTINFDRAFYGCENLTTISNLYHYRNINSIISAFEGCNKLTNVTFNTGIFDGRAVNLKSTFRGCNSLTSIVGLDAFSDIISLESAFDGCSSLPTIEFDSISNANTVNMKYAFRNCKKLTKIVSLEFISKVNDLTSTFEGCSIIENISVGQDVNSRSVSAEATFKDCLKLKKINNFEKLTNINNYKSTFENCNSLSVSRIGKNPNTLSAANLVNTYSGATNKNLYLKYLPSGTTDIPKQWKDQGYKNFVLPITITIPEQEDVKIGRALDLPADPVLPTYAAHRDGEYQLKKAGTSEWVTFNPTTTIDATYADAELRYIAKSYLSTSIVSSNIVIIRLKKPSLFISSEITVDTEEKYDTIQIDANGKLNINADITTEVLILKCTKGDRYNLHQDAGRISAKNIEIHVAADGATWTWFSVPFDFNMSEVIADNNSTHGTYNTAWQIKEYSENNRATQGFYGSNWQVVTSGSELSALHGYIVSNSVPASAPEDVKFKKSFGNTYTEINLQETVSVEFTDDDSKNDVGWNLISAPALEDTQFILSSDESEDIVVNIPINYGTGGYEQISSSQYTFKPSESFFVQVASAGELTFNRKSSANLAPSYMRNAVADNERYEIRISDANGNTDRATLTFRDDAPYGEYFIEHDVEKLTVYNDEPRIYYQDHGLRLAFSTVNTYDNADIPLNVYVPTAGEYVLNIPSNSAIEVYDEKYGQEINVSEYMFNVEEGGHVEGRFVVRHNINYIPTDETLTEKNEYEIITTQDGGIYISNLSAGTAIAVYSANGAILMQDVSGNDSYRLIDLPSGVYIVLVGGEANRVVVR